METKTWEVCIELSPLAGDRSTSQVAMNPQAKHGFQIYTKKVHFEFQREENIDDHNETILQKVSL